MTRRAYFLHRKCSIRVIRGQGSSRQGWHFGVNILTKNDEKMIDLESIQNHSRMVQGPPGHQTMTRRAYFLYAIE